MVLKRVEFVNGDVGEVGEEWIDRWPEDIKRVIEDDETVKPARKSSSRKSTAKKPSTRAVKKPAPEVPETHVGSVDAQKDEAP